MILAKIFQPNSSEDLPSADDSSTFDGSPQHARVESTALVVESASVLSVRGGEVDGADLALDRLLNEVALEARLAAGASGAAIALLRGNEMVCAASTGDAPDPGEGLDTRSGLVGASIQARKLQQCNDTETDPRVDPEACRRLRARSILSMPLIDGDELFGVAVLLSTQPNAFEQRHVHTLQMQTHRLLESRKKAKDAATPSHEESVSSSRLGWNQTTGEAVSPDRSNGSESVPKLPTEQRSYRAYDLWTTVLLVCVIGLAALLGALIGRRQEALTSQGKAHRANAASHIVTEAQSPGSKQPSSALDSSQAAGINPVSKQLGLGIAPPPGGLVVYQNGQAIFQKPASAPSPVAKVEASDSPQLSHADLPIGDGASWAEIRRWPIAPTVVAAANASMQPAPEELAAARLIHRVEPEYPAGAREQHIQGVVVLEVQIGTDGNIQNLTVIEGNPILSQAAVAAVKQWRYQPYSIGGSLVPMQTRITINFALPANN
jgi:TonB family protein